MQACKLSTHLWLTSCSAGHWRQWYPEAGDQGGCRAAADSPWVVQTDWDWPPQRSSAVGTSRHRENNAGQGSCTSHHSCLHQSSGLRVCAKIPWRGKDPHSTSRQRCLVKSIVAINFFSCFQSSRENGTVPEQCWWPLQSEHRSFCRIRIFEYCHLFFSSHSYWICQAKIMWQKCPYQCIAPHSLPFREYVPDFSNHGASSYPDCMQGPRMVRDVFRLAKENAPAIIFIDEVDAIATARFDAQTGADRFVFTWAPVSSIRPYILRPVLKDMIHPSKVFMKLARSSWTAS